MRNLNEPCLKTKADVVFLVDVTGSMQPCIDKLKQNVSDLAKSLEGFSNVSVDWRAKAIGYRDLECGSEETNFAGADNPFVSTSSALAGQLDEFVADGGGDEPESALDAIQLALSKEDWINVGEGHRIIVLLTDASTKVKTIDGVDVVEIARTAADGQFRLLIYGPRTDEYELLGKLPKGAFTDVATINAYEGLRNLDWNVLYNTLTKTVSTPLF